MFSLRLQKKNKGFNVRYITIFCFSLIFEFQFAEFDYNWLDTSKQRKMKASQ